MKQNRVFLFITSLVFLFSCGNSYVISPEKLEDVLVDLHIAEGIAVAKGSSYKKTDDKLDLYNFVYEKHGIDKALFDSTIHYYAEDTYALSDIYENVLARIVQLEKEVKGANFAISKLRMPKSVYDNIIKEDRSLISSIKSEMWAEGRSLIYDKSHFEKGKGYVFELDTLVGSTFELRFVIKSEFLASAKCAVTSVFDTDEKVQEFELPTDTTQLVVLSWPVASLPVKVNVDFSANKADDKGTLRFDYFRFYQLSDDKHSTRIFN